MVREYDEEATIRRAQAGDQAAFRLLFDAHYERTWRFARWRLAAHDPGLTDDAVQEAWLDAWRGLERFDPGRPFLPWLLAVVRNRCRQIIRGGIREREHFPPDDAGARDDALKPGREDAALEHVEHAADPALRGGLAALPPEQREVLELHYYVGLTLSEIAVMRGKPPGTVKKRLHLGLEKLRAALPAGHRAGAPGSSAA